MVRIGGSHPPDPGSIPGRGRQNNFVITFGRSDRERCSVDREVALAPQTAIGVETRGRPKKFRRDQEAGEIKKLKLIN